MTESHETKTIEDAYGHKIKLEYTRIEYEDSDLVFHDQVGWWFNEKSQEWEKIPGEPMNPYTRSGYTLKAKKK